MGTLDGITAYVSGIWNAATINETDDHIALAAGYYSDGNYARAAKEYEAALKDENLLPERKIAIYYNLANAYNESGKHFEAIKYYEKILSSLGGTYPKPYYNLTTTDKVLDYFDSYTRPAPKEFVGNVYHNSGMACLRQAGEREKSLKKGNPTIGSLNEVIDDYRRALEYFMKAVELFPDDNDSDSRVGGQRAFEKMREFQVIRDRLKDLPEYDVYNGTVAAVRTEPKKVDEQKLDDFKRSLLDIQPYQPPEAENGFEIETVEDINDRKIDSSPSAQDDVPASAPHEEISPAQQLANEIIKEAGLEEVVVQVMNETPEQLAQPDENLLAAEPEVKELPPAETKEESGGKASSLGGILGIESNKITSSRTLVPGVDPPGALSFLNKYQGAIATYSPVRTDLYFPVARYGVMGKSALTVGDNLPADPKYSLVGRKRITVTQKVDSKLVPLLIPSGGIVDIDSISLPKGSFELVRSDMGQISLKIDPSASVDSVTFEVVTGGRIPPDPEEEAKFLAAAQVYTSVPFTIDYSFNQELETFLRKLETEHPDFDTVKELEGWFKKNMTYDRTEETAKLYRNIGDASLANLVLKHRVGDCDVMNTAFMAVIRDKLKLPVRLVSGFYSDGGEVRAEDRHGWVEVYIKGMGWMKFDATPPEKCDVCIPLAVSENERKSIEERQVAEVKKLAAAVLRGEMELSDIQEYIVKEGIGPRGNLDFWKTISEFSSDFINVREKLGAGETETFLGWYRATGFGSAREEAFLKALLSAAVKYIGAGEIEVAEYSDSLHRLLTSLHLHDENDVTKFLAYNIIKSRSVVSIDGEGMKASFYDLGIVRASGDPDLMQAALNQLDSYGVLIGYDWLDSQHARHRMLSFAYRARDIEKNVNVLMEAVYKHYGSEGPAINELIKPGGPHDNNNALAYFVLPLLLNSPHRVDEGLEYFKKAAQLRELNTTDGNYYPFPSMTALLDHIDSEDVKRSIVILALESGKFEGQHNRDFVRGPLFDHLIKPGLNDHFEKAVQAWVESFGPHDFVVQDFIEPLSRVRGRDARERILDIFLRSGERHFYVGGSFQVDIYLEFMAVAFSKTSPEWAESRIETIRKTLNVSDHSTISQERAGDILRALDLFVDSKEDPKEKMVALRVSQEIVKVVERFVSPDQSRPKRGRPKVWPPKMPKGGGRRTPGSRMPRRRDDSILKKM